MNKEHIINEAYENYSKHFVGYDDIPKIDWFIQEIKNNKEFSEKWGLKIEERELSLEERLKISGMEIDNQMSFVDYTSILDEVKIPTKLITITYNNKTIKSKSEKFKNWNYIN
jgi:hypothetical protein